MQLTLQATCRTPHVPLRARCKQCLLPGRCKTRHTPSRHCRDARTYDRTTTAMHDIDYTPLPPPPFPPPHPLRLPPSSNGAVFRASGQQPLLGTPGSSVDRARMARERVEQLRRADGRGKRAKQRFEWRQGTVIKYTVHTTAAAGAKKTGDSTKNGVPAFSWGRRHAPYRTGRACRHFSTLASTKNGFEIYTYHFLYPKI